ncbi:class I SAM-dependent methyltransferase [Kibdelosporangium philippinense]|uniref:Class I SAM-dependent methyltransferase n=1 Tax=Kibdelosporangium philippinense TaxID=211113 RepID=A0ABS8Z6G6_9PSEU|nr:class I SAM-dependent methyltransferase [Kibdelosporangium philippinense]MCE7001452.1 class I SAM-dependent methyltransferase [Kibdelosporangium philippinense]
MSETNAEQRAAWNGADGDFWVERADRFDEGMANYMEPFFAAAAIQSTENVLDIGCGNGLTSRVAAASANRVLGVDLSVQMLELARQRSAGIPNVQFEQADAQVYAFAQAEFDVAISRNGSMFFDDPIAVFTNIRRALKRGGRLVLLVWQSIDEHEAISTFRTILAAGRDLPKPPPNAPHPFSLSDPERVHTVLGRAGFDDIRLAGLREPMYVGRDPQDAAEYVTSMFGRLIEEGEQDTVTAALLADMAEHQTSRGVEYGSAAWLISAANPS